MTGTAFPGLQRGMSEAACAGMQTQRDRAGRSNWTPAWELGDPGHVTSVFCACFPPIRWE